LLKVPLLGLIWPVLLPSFGPEITKSGDVPHLARAATSMPYKQAATGVPFT
jgi:hypothetical protein